VQVLHVVGARPNFMKVAPVVRALDQGQGVKQRLVHTGQHYDANMSHVFFEQLGIPAPEVNLSVGSRSPHGKAPRRCAASNPSFSKTSQTSFWSMGT